MAVPNLRRVRAGLVIVVMGACDASVGERAEPTPPSAAVAAATAEAQANTPAPAKVPSLPLGWWRSEGLCLELFANGDFELALMGSGPKHLIMGTASLVAAGADAFTAALAVQRIWAARFTGPCKRTHELGEWKQSEDALGSTFATNAKTSMKLRRLAEDRVELCGSTCVTLARDTPTFGGRWRQTSIEDASRPTEKFTAGDLLEIDVATQVPSHLWAAKDATSWAAPSGTFAITSIGDDRFDVTFTPTGSDEPARVLDRAIESGKPIAFTARRLPGERLEMCTAADRCAILERRFDAYDHDIR